MRAGKAFNQLPGRSWCTGKSESCDARGLRKMTLFEPHHIYFHRNQQKPGNSLVVQCSGLHTFTAEGAGSVPGWGNKILQTARRSRKKTPTKTTNKQTKHHPRNQLEPAKAKNGNSPGETQEDRCNCAPGLAGPQARIAMGTFVSCLISVVPGHVCCSSDRHHFLVHLMPKPLTSLPFSSQIELTIS